MKRNDMREKGRTKQTLGAEGEVVEGIGSDLKTSGGGADVVEAVLEEIHFQIGLLF